MRIGVIGYGLRIRNVIQEILSADSSVNLVAITDIRNEEIQRELGAEACAHIQFFENPDDMIKREKLDGILIGTRCNLHADLMIHMLPAGIPIFLEKPVATNIDDLYRLRDAYEAAGHKQVLVSFPLRVTPIVRYVKEVIDSGKMGTIEHVQAVNNVPYGGVYYHYWYRDESQSHGLFLAKATHDFDYINYLLGLRPVKVCAMKSKQVFKGNKPAGLKCSENDDPCGCGDECQVPADDSRIRYCAFAEDTGNEDSGSAIVQYDSGMHVVYSQNFIVRRDAGARGARLVGYKGTIEFDFYTQTVKTFMHHSPEVNTHVINPDDRHFGGDAALAHNFIEMMKGTAGPTATLEDGLLSAYMCLRTKKSSETYTFQEIDWE